MRPMIGTSWKMNLTPSEAADWFTVFVPLAVGLPDVDLFVLPSFPSIALARDRLAGTAVAWGAQDVSPYDNGEHTGDVSAAMLADLGCRYVEVGHSERRREHAETPDLIGSKIRAVLRAGMDVILCTGELDPAPVQAAIGQVCADLDACLANVTEAELGRVVVAYEPAWAIGSGHRPADPQRVGRVHRAIAGLLGSAREPARSRVVYGGSVDAASAPRLLAEPGVDGLFVGRNALDPRAFALIAGARPRP